jgi:hypothetical protein
MSNAPEWVDPEGEPLPPPRIDDRAIVTQSVRGTIEAVRSSAQIIANLMLRLDEMGEPVKRSRFRSAKLIELIDELDAVFQYDVEQGNGARTVDQKIRRERHELS